MLVQVQNAPGPVNQVVLLQVLVERFVGEVLPQTGVLQRIVSGALKVRVAARVKPNFPQGHPLRGLRLSLLHHCQASHRNIEKK